MMAQTHDRMIWQDPDFLVERTTWTATVTYLGVAGLVTLMALPRVQTVSNVTPASSTPSLEMDAFIVIFSGLFGILALTFGQAEPRWQGRLGWLGQLGQLGVRVGFGLVLGLPYLAAYLLAQTGSLAVTGMMAVYMAAFGVLMGVAGWRLALTNWTDMVRFNVKYLGFATYLAVTGLGQTVGLLAALGPVDGAMALLARGASAWPSLALSVGLWALGGVIGLASIRRTYARSTLCAD